MTEPSDELMNLIFTGIDHGIESVRDGGPLVPFVLVEHEGQVALRRIVVGDPFELEASVEQAAVSAREAAAEAADRVVLVYDAYLRMGDERFDAIYAEGAEDGALAAVIAQRYKPKGRFRSLETIGDAQALPPDMGRLAAMTASDADVTTLTPPKRDGQVYGG
jgi:hypothetical protein